MRNFAIFLAAIVCLSACGGDAGQDITHTKRRNAQATSVAGIPAVRTTRLDFASCLAEDVADEAAQSRCPSFALLSLDYMSSQCSRSGGTLKARAALRGLVAGRGRRRERRGARRPHRQLRLRRRTRGLRLRQHRLPLPALQEARRHLGRDRRHQRRRRARPSRCCPPRKASSRHCAAAASASSPAASSRTTSGTGSEYARTWIDFKGHRGRRRAAAA